MTALYDFRLSNFNYTAGTGTLDSLAGTAAIVGSSTAFTTQLQAGGVLVCNGYTLAIDAITDNTHLTLQSLAPATWSGKTFTFNNLTNVETLAGYPHAPRSTFQPWAETVDLGNGLKRALGRPLATWSWGFLTQAQRNAFRAYVADVSASLYVRTKTLNNSDVYKTYLAAVLWPDQEDVQATVRLNFTLNFRDMVLL